MKQYQAILRWIALPFAAIVIPPLAFLITIYIVSSFIPETLRLPLGAFIHGAMFTTVATACAPSHKRRVKIVARIVLIVWTVAALCLRDLSAVLIAASVLDVIGGLVFPVTDSE